MTVLIDLNVLLDVIQRREPHYADSAAVLSRIAAGELEGAVAGHAMTTIYYVVAKFSGRHAAEEAIDWILGSMEVVAESRDVLLRARSLDMDDFEDAVVAAAAERAHADRIVTRKLDDFEHAPVPAVTPRELLIELDDLDETLQEEEAEQEKAYRDLLTELGTADDGEVQAALEDREATAPEEGATESLGDRLHSR